MTLLKSPPDRLPLKVLPKSSVTGLFGPKGSGKSAAMAYYLEMNRRLGKNVFYFPEKYRFHDGTALTFEQLVTLAELDPTDDDGYMTELNGAAVGIDEFQQVFSKYRSSTLANRAIGSFMQQIRKRGVTMFFTSNDPDGIDQAAETQTDEHAFCKYTVDRRCEDWHRLDCSDFITLNYVDTHGRTGPDSRFMDGRRRATRYIEHAITLSQYYNTFAAISAQEVGQMNASAVMGAYENVKTGVSQEDLARFFRIFIIPWLVVEKGATQILPAAFIDSVLPTINQATFEKQDLIDANIEGIRLPLKISVKHLGQVLMSLGLTKKRGSGGYRYQLPEKGDIEDWAQGILQA